MGIKGKSSGIQEFSFFVTALKGSLKEVTDRSTRTFNIVFNWLYRVIKAFKLCFCSHKHVFNRELPLPQDMLRATGRHFRNFFQQRLIFYQAPIFHHDFLRFCPALFFSTCFWISPWVLIELIFFL